MKLAFLDTETTGLDRYKNEIIELALIIIEDGERTVEQSWKLKPRRIETASDYALQLNGYDKEVWDKEGKHVATRILRKLRKRPNYPGTSRKVEYIDQEIKEHTRTF